VFYLLYFNKGLLELKPGTILFARPLTEDGVYQEENDIVEAWCLDGYVYSLLVLIIGKLNTYNNVIEMNSLLLRILLTLGLFAIPFSGQPMTSHLKLPFLIPTIQES